MHGFYYILPACALPGFESNTDQQQDRNLSSQKVSAASSCPKRPQKMASLPPDCSRQPRSTCHRPSRLGSGCCCGSDAVLRLWPPFSFRRSADAPPSDCPSLSTKTHIRPLWTGIRITKALQGYCLSVARGQEIQFPVQSMLPPELGQLIPGNSVVGEPRLCRALASRKFLSRAAPCVVATLSGWNWTPQWGLLL